MKITSVLNLIVLVLIALLITACNPTNKLQAESLSISNSMIPSSQDVSILCDEQIDLNSRLVEEMELNEDYLQFDTIANRLTASESLFFSISDGENRKNDLKDSICKLVSVSASYILEEDINKPLSKGEAILHKAAFCSDAIAVNGLIDFGASLSQVNDDGETALDVAKKYGNEEVIAILTNEVK